MKIEDKIIQKIEHLKIYHLEGHHDNEMVVLPQIKILKWVLSEMGVDYKDDSNAN